MFEYFFFIAVMEYGFQRKTVLWQSFSCPVSASSESSYRFFEINLLMFQNGFSQLMNHSSIRKVIRLSSINNLSSSEYMKGTEILSSQISKRTFTFLNKYFFKEQHKQTLRIILCQYCYHQLFRHSLCSTGIMNMIN